MTSEGSAPLHPRTHRRAQGAAVLAWATRAFAWVRSEWGALFALALGCFMLGFVGRVLGYAEPDSYLFDERHFVEGAHSYLNALPDGNDHPPLGKLWVAACIQLFGDEAGAYRLPSVVFGLALIPLAGWLGARAFRSMTSGFVSAALVALDGFLLTYSRVALLDVPLAFFGLLAVALVVAVPNVGGFALAGAVAGLATCTKYSGVASLCVVGLAAALEPRWSFGKRSRAAIGAILGFLVAYFAVWELGLHLMGQPGGAGWRETVRLFEHHARLTAMDHPFASSWPSWFVPTTPITLWRRVEEDQIRVMTSLGNLAIWWSVVLVALGTVVAVAWRGARRFVVRRQHRPLLVFAGWIAFILPWVLTRRDSYVYHYLPAYVFGIVYLGGLLGRLAPRHPVLVTGFVAVSLVVSAFYLPVWLGLPLHASGLEARLFSTGWQ